MDEERVCWHCPATYEEIIATMEKASENRLAGMLRYTENAVVPQEYAGDARAGILNAGAGVSQKQTFCEYGGVA